MNGQSDDPTRIINVPSAYSSDFESQQSASDFPTSAVDQQHRNRQHRNRSRSKAGARGATLFAVAIAGGVVGATLTASGGSTPTSMSTRQAATFNEPNVVRLENTKTQNRPAQLTQATVAGTPSTAPTPPSVPDLIARILPSVVDISVVLPQGKATGSGFVTSSDGRIVTNAHVVADATNIKVTFADKSTAVATVVGVDRTDDLAVIHVDRNGLQALELGSSADLRMGVPVVAIGSALALTGGPTATEGIVSALNRSIDTDNGEHLSHLLQTDAAINPGNSGGPLLTLDGKVVGINSAGSTGAQNIGFAIAIDTAKPIIGQLAAGQQIKKGFLGVGTQPIDASFAAQYGLDVDHGLLVINVTPGSAAAKAGIQAGDIIVDANGQATDDGGTLGQVIQDAGAGNSITLRIRRNGIVSTHTASIGTTTA